MRDKINELRDGPVRDRYSLTRVGDRNALRVLLMQEAWQGTRDPDNPGKVDQYYFADEELVVIDLTPDNE
jgi:hypothetical protein